MEAEVLSNQIVAEELYVDKLFLLELPVSNKFLLTIVVITTIFSSMVSKLQTELKQNKPFVSLEEEALLNLARTAEVVSSAIAIVLKQADLTGTQYNALRILRGAGPDGLSCGEVSERMVTKDSDITRLLDRLESRGLISRERPANNRRTVIARITDAGLRLLADLDDPVSQSNRRLAGHLGKERLKTLNTLLEDLRSKLI
jgi:DNA-binding MarR family transcriptional regulator